MKEIRNTCETISPTDGMTLMETLVMEKKRECIKIGVIWISKIY